MKEAAWEIPNLSEKDKERFWKQVDRNDCDCWLWTGTLYTTGYGQFKFRTRNFRAHRLSFVLNGGSFDGGPQVLHKCRNRNCVNPVHLYAGTHKQNMTDKIRDGTTNRGYKNGNYTHPEKVKRGAANPAAKLTSDDVREIRRLRETGLFYHDIAARFGIRKQQACKICKRQRWQHVM